MKPRKLNVMVVDDSPVVLEHVRHALERAGHTVITRESALGTASQVIKARPDVVMLDVSMPAIDGDRLVTVVRDVKKDIILILHSSLPAARLQQISEASGAHGYIAKTADSTHFLCEFHRIVFGEAVPFIAQRRPAKFG